MQEALRFRCVGEFEVAKRGLSRRSCCLLPGPEHDRSCVKVFHASVTSFGWLIVSMGHLVNYLYHEHIRDRSQDCWEAGF